jgi:HEAT repeat protein
MEVLDIFKLIRTRKPALVKHAMQAWERDHSGQVEVLIETIKLADAELIETALLLAAKYHPEACAAEICTLLANPEARVRRLAVQAINIRMAKACSQPLSKLLADETDVFVLASAANAAAELHLDVECLKPALRHTDIRVRANAVRAVARCCPARIQELLEPMLQDKALRVQNEALRALAQFVPEKDLEQLISRRMQSDNPSVRAATAFIAGELPISMRMPFLLEALSDKDARVVSNATRSLCKIHDPAGLRAVISTYFNVAEKSLASALLRQLNPEDSYIFVELAESAGKPGKLEPELLMRIIAAALHFNDWERLLPWLMAAVDHDNCDVRLAALQVVMQKINFFSSNIDRMVEKARRQQPGDCPVAFHPLEIR